VAAGFVALSDDGVSPRLDSNLRLLNRADLDQDLDAIATCLADPRGRIAPEEHDDRRPFLDAHLNHAVAHHARQKVDAERLWRQGA